MIVTPQTYPLPFWHIGYSEITSKWSVWEILLFKLMYWVLGVPYPVAQCQNLSLAII